MDEKPEDATVDKVKLPLERDLFMRTLISQLAETLEEVVGREEASGFISLVGQKMGEEIGSFYLDALGQKKLSSDQVPNVLVDLKKRIHGDFFLVEKSDDQLVFGNRRCPFEDKVKGHPSMCMMTSSVFGSIAAATHGYARVEIQETIADGADGCKVVVHLRRGDDSSEPAGIEYFEK